MNILYDIIKLHHILTRIIAKENTYFKFVDMEIVLWKF
jgi:hypothetical protein